MGADQELRSRAVEWGAVWTCSGEARSGTGLPVWPVNLLWLSTWTRDQELLA